MSGMTIADEIHISLNSVTIEIGYACLEIGKRDQLGLKTQNISLRGNVSMN